MKEVRLSIPIIGGVTVIYTRDEIEQKKQAVKRAVSKGIAYTARLGSMVISSIANKMEGKPAAWVVPPVVDDRPVSNGRVDPCPSCGGSRPNGQCSAHGRR